MTEPLYPGTDIVGTGWLKLNPLLPAGRIATKLPKDDAALQAPGFIRTLISGGTPGRDMPWRSPVITAQCWTAPVPGSQKLPWGAANQLAERVLMMTYDGRYANVRVDLSALDPNFVPARVATVIAISEPRRIDDPSGYARFDVDLLMNWRIDA